MKLVFTFFLLLCSYLPGRSAYAHTRLHGSTTCSAHHLHVQKKKAEADYHVTVNDNVLLDIHDLPNIEDEADEYLLKKPVTRHVASFSRLLFSSRHTCPSKYLFYWRYLSHSDTRKYIAQRVLKI